MFMLVRLSDGLAFVGCNCLVVFDKVFISLHMQNMQKETPQRCKKREDPRQKFWELSLKKMQAVEVKDSNWKSTHPFTNPMPPNDQ